MYSLSKANLEYKISNPTSESILCLSCFNEIVYSGTEQYILKWDLEERAVKRYVRMYLAHSTCFTHDVYIKIFV